MRTHRPRRSTLLLLSLFSVAIACGAREPSATLSPTATVTLTEGACVADGLGALIPQHFVVTLVNDTPYAALYNLRRMNDGHAYQELELFIADQQRRFLAETEQMDPPTFTTPMAVRSVGSRQTDRIDNDLPSGTYGLVCRGVKTPKLWTAYIVGPLRVP